MRKENDLFQVFLEKNGTNFKVEGNVVVASNTHRVSTLHKCTALELL